jgi:hypothetical protein
MNNKSHRQGSVLAAGALGTVSLFLWHAPAIADLGGDVRSVSVDRAALRGQLQSTSMQQYDVHEISGPDGAMVREYATPQGKVFAVSWQGPMPPDLQQLFGSYFSQYQAAASASAEAHPGMHRQLSIAQPDFVVQSLGRMRAFHGKAYVPSLVPAGVSVADLP